MSCRTGWADFCDFAFIKLTWCLARKRDRQTEMVHGQVQRNVWIQWGEYLRCVILSVERRGGGGGGCGPGSSLLPGRSPAVHTEGRTVYLSGSAWQPLRIGSRENLHWLSIEMGVVGGGDIHRRINTS